MRRLLFAALLALAVFVLTPPSAATYDPGIDPAAPPQALWTKLNPSPADCAELARLVAVGALAPEARYDPAAPCERP